jgi:hypothetical protein
MYLTLACAALAIPIIGTFWAMFRGRLHPLGIPPLVAGAFAYLYLWNPLYLSHKGTLAVFLSEGQILQGIVVAAAAYLCLLFGWRLGGKRVGGRPWYRGEWNVSRLYQSGTVLVVAGMVLFLAFINQSGGIQQFYLMPHGAAGRWEEQTAWVYLGLYLVYPGLTLMAIAATHRRTGVIGWLPFALAVALMIGHATVSSSRGTLFPTIVAAMFSVYFARGKSPRPLTMAIGGFTLMLALLLLVGYRSELVAGSSTEHVDFADALTAVFDVSDADVRSGSTGNEFIYHAALIDGVQRSGRLAYGLNWLYTFFVHPIPRILWPSKPYNWYIGLTGGDLYQLNGWIVSSGSASGAVADLWTQFSVLSLLLWSAIGWLMRRVFERAVLGHPVWIVVYVNCYCWGLHMLAQGVSAILVPVAYSLIPALLLTSLCRKRAAVVPLLERWDVA